MIKKYLSLCLAFLMVFSSIQIASADDVQELEFELKLSDACYIRNSSKNNEKNTALGGDILVIDNANSPRMFFLKFDFAEYIKNIDDIGEIKLHLVASDVNQAPVNNFTVYLMPDSVEDWSSSTLTWVMAENDGMTTGGNLIYTSEESVAKDEWAQTADLSEAVKQHLLENPSNTEVTFRIHTTIACAYVFYGVGSGFEPKLTLKQEINPEKIIQDVYDELTFESINPDDSTCVTSMFTLPVSGVYNTRITWASSDETIVNSQTGIVTRPGWGSGDKLVTLTATIENSGCILTKEFEFTVSQSDVYPDEMLLEEECLASDSTFVRGGTNFKDTIVNNGNIVVDATSGVNHRMGFVKFDFTGYEEYLEKANSMQLKLDVTSDAKAENNNNFVVYMLPEEYEDIDTYSLTYTMAKDSGLIDYADNFIWLQNGVAPATAYRSGDILSAVKSNLENGDNSVVWFKVAATTNVGYSIYGSGASSALKPAVYIRYPKPDCDLDLLNMKLPDSVRGDIELPQTGDFGSTITWESSNEEIISTTGKVKVDIADEDYSKEDVIVTLKATAVSGDDSFEREFDIRVIRSGVRDAVCDITASESEMDFDGAELTFGGASGQIPVVYFDISDDSDSFTQSRKTVLKLYGSKDSDGKKVKAIPVTDEILKGLDEESITFTDAMNMASVEYEYVYESSFENGYAVIDVTEYIRSLSDGKAVFVLSSDGARVSVVSQNGELLSRPKLIASPNAYTDKYAADYVADSIDFSDLTTDLPDAVRASLSLPESGRFGSTIKWICSDEGILNPTTGELKRPLSDTIVTLKAVVTVGVAKSEKSFEINVIKEESDKEYAEYLVSTLKPDYDILTSSITLKGEELSDVAQVEWESSEPYEAKVEGFNLVLNRPSSADLPVTLTSKLTYNGETVTASFNVTVVRSANKNILRSRKITSGDQDASKALDEDISTVWQIKENSFAVDMGSAKVMSGVTIVPEESDFAGITVSVSDDMYKWEKVYSGGSFTAGKLNYITLSPIAYGRYVKFEFPSSAKAISFIGAYNVAGSSDGDVFAGIEIPAEAKKDFELPESLYGNRITWISSSKIISINGYTAEVNPASNGKNVTLTAEVEINGEKHTRSYVVYVPGSGSSSGGGGGGSKSSGGTGFVASPTVTPSVVQPEQTGFTDLHLAPWATEYINYLTDKAIVNGKSKTQFAPNDNLKREEMAKIITLAFALSESQNASGFTDVNENEWYAPYVTSLKISGITKGMGDGSFGVGLDITRQDAFTMIASVLGCDTSSSDKTSFNDDAAISEYARGSVNALVSLGIVGGDENGNVNPTAKITRAEIAKVICLAISYK